MELIYSKTIDKSVLWDGFSIKSIFLDVVTRITGVLDIGESRRIKLVLNGKIYNDIELKNQAFNRDKYPTHKEMYQVRYSPKSEFSKDLRLLYSDVWQYIVEQRNIQENLAKLGYKRKNITIPSDLNRKIAFFTSDTPDTWIVETYDANDNEALLQSIDTTNELEYECTDTSASVIERTKKIKLRILNRTIGNNLKRLYQYRCQICGESIGLLYGNDQIADAHHISPFIESHNNNYDNIMILCPNHHRIIHQCNGIFTRKYKEIWYPNGLHEPLKLNLHL